MVSCPPVCIPSITRGFKSALAAYMAAVSPAGPEPIIITLRMSLLMLLLAHYYLLIAFHSLHIASYLMSVLFHTLFILIMLTMMCRLLAIITVCKLGIHMNDCLIQVLKGICSGDCTECICVFLLCNYTTCRHISA